MNQSTAARRVRKPQKQQQQAKEFPTTTAASSSSSVEALAAAVDARPGRWKDRLVYADALEDVGRTEEAAWQREIVACVRDMGAVASKRLADLKAWAEPMRRPDSDDPDRARPVRHLHSDNEVSSHYAAIGKTALAEVTAAVTRSFVRRMAVAGTPCAIATFQWWGELFAPDWRPVNPLAADLIHAGWPLVRERIAEYDAERLAKYEELRRAMADADDE